jgi:hypothetical protein
MEGANYSLFATRYSPASLVPATHPRPSFADQSHECFASKKNKGRRSAEKAQLSRGATPRDQMLPPVCASGAAARPTGRARLSALHRGARQVFNPDSAPGRVSWNRRVQTGGPSPAPVQRAPRGPVIVPDERGPEAARGRTVSFRPRGPLSLRYQEHPHDGVPYLSEMPRLSAKMDATVKRRHQATMLRPCKPLESNLFCAISQKRDRPWRSAA